jgi:hypothetical protein
MFDVELMDSRDNFDILFVVRFFRFTFLNLTYAENTSITLISQNLWKSLKNFPTIQPVDRLPLDMLRLQTLFNAMACFTP